MRYKLLLVLLGAVAPGCMSESYMDRFEDRATTVENRMKGELRRYVEENRREFESYLDKLAVRFEEQVKTETAEIRRILEDLGNRTEGNIKDFKKDIADLRRRFEELLERYGIEMK